MSTRYIYVELISQQHGMTMNYTHTQTYTAICVLCVCVYV